MTVGYQVVAQNRELDLNQRHQAHRTCELPDCSIPASQV